MPQGVQWTTDVFYLACTAFQKILKLVFNMLKSGEFISETQRIGLGKNQVIRSAQSLRALSGWD